MTNRSPLWPRLLPWIVVALVSAVAWGDLPERIAVHFTLDGTPDSYGSRAFAVVLVPLFMMGIWGTLLLSAHRAEASTARALGLAADCVAGLALFMHVAIIAYALGHPVSMPRAAGLAAGVIFVVLGNGLGRTRPNPWVGVRTPATMADPDLWRRVNRLAGRLMVVAGIGIAVSGFVPELASLAFVGVMALMLVPLACSWWWSRGASS